LIKERPGELSESAIIVGDPDRVLLLSQLLDETVVKTGLGDTCTLPEYMVVEE